jgi:hypothetical protein
VNEDLTFTAPKEFRRDTPPEHLDEECSIVYQDIERTQHIHHVGELGPLQVLAKVRQTSIALPHERTAHRTPKLLGLNPGGQICAVKEYRHRPRLLGALPNHVMADVATNISPNTPPMS